MANILIKNALIVNEGVSFTGSVQVENGIISRIFNDGENLPTAEQTIDAKGKLLMPGVIDDQVHFREPGLTHKADIYHESRAALAGGVTSFMEMPNTKPAATTLELLEEKYELGKQHSAINYSFYFGATNENVHLLKELNAKTVCGVKVFMGSSTGNMLVDEEQALTSIFSTSPLLVATHCEDEATIRKNTEEYVKRYGENIPFSAHPLIRSREACYKSSAKAVELAKRYNTRLHILHLSTAEEVELFSQFANLKTEEKRITAEVCAHHLWYCDEDYENKGALIKCNPAIKTANDRAALQYAFSKGIIDMVATDHAPHTFEEKNTDYLHSPSGLPLIQFSLSAMFELYHKGIFSLETIVERMCHAPAKLFNISKRGFIREGYHADITLVDLNNPFTVERKEVLSKCGWSPFEGQTFQSKVSHVLINGLLAYENGIISNNSKGERLTFDR